jgi:tripartite-type tricarboxylate transporter receptor subunit TctC
MRFVKRLAPAALVLAGLGLAAASAAVADVGEFYKGKSVRILIGFSPGGGFDAYGRLVARHLGKHIPGNPNLVPQNLPGASGLKAVQSLEARSKDGTTIVIFNAGIVLKSLTDPKAVPVRFTDVAFLGSVSSDIRVCYMWHATGVKTWEDLTKRQQIAYGATSKGSGSYLDSSVLKNVFKLPVKQIIGYPGSAEQRLAIERGELDGDCGSFESIPAAWVRDNKINVTHRNSKNAPPGIEAPFILDLAKTDEQKKVLNVILSVNDIFRPFVVAKDTPADRLKALRDALWATVQDKDFLADAKRSKRTINSPVRGEDANRIVAEMYATPPDLVKKAAAAIK